MTCVRARVCVCVLVGVDSVRVSTCVCVYVCACVRMCGCEGVVISTL